jgi:23S rRNA (uracil1939-C5)-methyltransferase
MARRGTWKPYGQAVEVEISAAGPGGEGLGLADGARYRIHGALPGERVRARIFGRKTGWRMAALEEVLRESADRRSPRCPSFGQCGGCAWQNLAYPAQLALLEERVRALLAPWVGPHAWAPILGAEEVFHYRGKIELSFGGETGALRLGFNRRGRYWEVVDLDECHIGPPVNRQIIERVKSWASRAGLAPYRTRSGEGFLRHLVIRQGRGGGWLAALVTRSGELPDEAGLVASLSAIDPPGSLLWVCSDTLAQAVKVEESRLLLGDGRLVERLGGIEYVLGLESFFQANAEMAERLVGMVRERALAGPHGRVLDLFCGVGTIALALADACAEVVGVEAVGPAVTDAQLNADARGWRQVRFVLGEAEKYLWDEGTDLVILDPPRSGLHPRLPRRLVEHPVPRVIYVSCNPEALARDLAVLGERYAATFARCVDLFPHTPHVETVVELNRMTPDQDSLPTPGE